MLVGATSLRSCSGQASPRSIAIWGSLLLCLLFMADAAFALVPVPPLQARVTDLTGTISAEQKASIQEELRLFEASQGSQIAVLIVPTTQPEAIEQYGIRVVEEWKLGREAADDGALLLIAKDDRALRIEVGYGLEGALNDATAKRIIAEIITPYFRNGDFFEGIQAGVQAMMKVVEGEPLPAPTPARDQEDGLASILPGVFFCAFVLGQMFRGMAGTFPSALGAGAVSAGVIWLVTGFALGALLFGFVLFAILMLSGLGGGRGLGAGGYYAGGGLGGGSGGGGGFSSGGGGFGGGGASGRW